MQEIESQTAAGSNGKDCFLLLRTRSELKKKFKAWTKTQGLSMTKALNLLMRSAAKNRLNVKTVIRQKTERDSQTGA